MDNLVIAFGPAFAAGLAVQRLLEILDPLAEMIVEKKEVNKKLLLGFVSFIMGLALAFGAGLRILQPLGATHADLLDVVVTGLIISAGTEGFNSIIKFLGYTKELRKEEAKEKQK
jgi:hypothetical protein